MALVGKRDSGILPVLFQRLGRLTEGLRRLPEAPLYEKRLNLSVGSDAFLLPLRADMRQKEASRSLLLVSVENKTWIFCLCYSIL